MSRPFIDPSDARVQIDGEWVTIPQGYMKIRKEYERLEELKSKPRPVSWWDKIIATFLVILVPFIFSSFMQDIWTSNDLDVSTKILLTFTVGFTSVLWIVVRMMWWGEEG